MKIFQRSLSLRIFGRSFTILKDPWRSCEVFHQGWFLLQLTTQRRLKQLRGRGRRDGSYVYLLVDLSVDLLSDRRFPFLVNLFVFVYFFWFRIICTCNFWCNFCRTFQCNFCRARARDKNRKCKLAAISVQFLCDLSPRYRSDFEHVGNLMQLGGDFCEIATNISLESCGNRN